MGDLKVVLHNSQGKGGGSFGRKADKASDKKGEKIYLNQT